MTVADWILDLANRILPATIWSFAWKRIMGFQDDAVYNKINSNLLFNPASFPIIRSFEPF
jgi:hypothetical protein